MEPTKSKWARRYDRDFKENAVSLVRSGRGVREVARDLGVSYWSLKNWVKAAESGQEQTEVGTLAFETAEAREIRRLRYELDYVSRQRDILKKALGIVSAEMPRGDSR